MLELIKLEKKNQYNNKIDHRFIQHLTPKLIYPYLVRKDLTSEFSQKYCGYVNFKNTRFTLASLIALGKIFKVNTGINEETVKSIIKKTKGQNIDKLFELLRNLVQNRVFGSKTREISLIIFNKMVIDKGYLPVIFYRDYNEIIYRHILKAETSIAIMAINQLAELTRDYYNIKREPKTAQEIKVILKNNQTFLAVNFNIKSLGIFGSFVRNSTNCYSDLDLWYQTDKPLSPEDRLTLKQVISNLLELTVDLIPHDTGYDLKRVSLFEENLVIF